MSFRRRRGGKPDANQQPIVDALRQIGASVTVISSVGFGTPDLLVGWHGYNFLLKIKVAGKALTPQEMKWASDWRGQVAISESVEDALLFVRAIG